MRTICFPINELKIGGAEQQLLELVRGLDKQQFRPIVAPLYAGGALDAEFAAVPGVDVVHLNRQGKYDFTPILRLFALLRDRHVDIVQPFLSPSTFFGLLSSLLAGTSTRVVTERCGVRRVRRLGYKLYRTAEDILTRAADITVANSEAGRALLWSRGIAPHKITVVYNGINLERLRPDASEVTRHRARLGVPPGGRVVGILASLTPPKGHQTFLEAAALISAHRSDVRYAIIGDGPLRSELEQLAVTLGVRGQTVFFGSQRRVADYLAACDLIVSASSDNEGCSNSILEAMALRVPVIGTDVGGNREVITDGVTGYLIPSGRPARLAESALSILDDPTGTAAVAERARQMIDARFSLRAMVAAYEALYVRLSSSAVIAPEAPEGEHIWSRSGSETRSV